MNKAFNSLSYAHDFPMTDIEKVRIAQVLSLFPQKSTILDLGCGDGYFMEVFRKDGHQVEGIEIAENAVKKARKKGFTVYDVSLMGKWSQLIKKKYDVVFGGEIIEHVFDTDLFLQEIRKVLKKNGVLVITTPNIAALGRRLMLLLGISPHIETTARQYDAGHIRYFTRAAMKQLLEENDFRVVSMQSSVINFNNQGTLFSRQAAQLFPSLGNNIIVQAVMDTSQ